MKSKRGATSRKRMKTPKGFWDRSAPSAAVISVRNSSRLARVSAFLLRFLGLGRRGGSKNDS